MKRARKLDFADRFDMIRWLGKAAVGLIKREYAAQLIEAVQLLTLAYRSAGLPWAARASCIFAAASIVIEGEEDSELPVSIVPTMKVWAWNALGLCHLPDFLFALQLLNGFVAGLPLTEESKAKVRDDIRELDMGLASLFLNLEEAELQRLEGIPDILEALGLLLARTALLYALGHQDILREDGSLPAEETDDGVKRVLSMLKSQRIPESLGGPLILNGEGPQILVTTILGMRVEVEIDGSESILIAECILGSLEAFFATIGQRVAPHSELFRIAVSQSGDARKPVIQTSELDMASSITWPHGLSVTQFDRQHDVRPFFSEVAAHVLGATCMVRDANTLIENLYTDEAVQQRITMIAAASNSYSRVASRSITRLSDWQEVVRRSYPLRDQRVELSRISLPRNAEQRDENCDASDQTFEIKNHRGMSISSVIDVHTWDKAVWRGCGYLQIGHTQPPFMAFLFENAAAARKIFDRWRARFGEEDVNEEVAISIIRYLPETNPHHYWVQVTSGRPILSGNTQRRPVLMATRSMTMEPTNSTNLNTFLAAFERFGVYYLLPAVGTTNPDFFYDLIIMKRRLIVKAAAEIGEGDVESLALRIRGLNFSS